MSVLFYYYYFLPVFLLGMAVLNGVVNEGLSAEVAGTGQRKEISHVSKWEKCFRQRMQQECAVHL